MGLRAGLDGRKISPHPDSIPGPSSPFSVAIPTELPGPKFQSYIRKINKGKKLCQGEKEANILITNTLKLFNVLPRSAFT